MKKRLKALDGYILVVIFAVLLYFLFRIIEPFFMAIIGSALLCYIFYPVYLMLKKKIKSEKLSALLVTILIIILITIPILLITNVVINEAIQAYSRSSEFNLDSLISTYNLKPEINSYIESAIRNSLSLLIKSMPSFLLSIPQKLISLFIMIFTLFYFFKDGERLKRILRQLLPKRIQKEKILMIKFKQIIYAVIYGNIVISILEGLFLTLGLYLFNGPSPFLWGAIAAILATLPIIGPAIVWFPIVVIKYLQGDTFNAIALFFYCLILLSFFLDTWAKPHVVGGKAKLHPVLTILGVIGGLKLFGFMGFILGPLILAMFVGFLELYLGESYEAKSKKS